MYNIIVLFTFAARVFPGMHFVINNGRLGFHYFHEFATDV